MAADRSDVTRRSALQLTGAAFAMPTSKFHPSHSDKGRISTASWAELAGRDGAATGRAYLAEAGRAGSFVFDPSDLSAMVSADPNQGMFIAPASAPTGVSGAWVRRFSGSVNVKWFGATGDGATDDGAAFAAALALLKAIAVNQVAGWYQGSPKLFVPAGHYFLGTTTLDISHSLVIEGEGTGQAGGIATKLRWAAGATGIRVQRYNTVGASATTAPGFNAGDGTIIRGLCLAGGYGGTEGEFHGIHLRARALIEDCRIQDFQGDGIHANAASGGSPEGNANNSVVNRVTIQHCRKGLFFDGADTNACLVTMLEASANRQWGVDDSSFLGNTYVACHTAANGWDGAAGSIPTACTHGGNRYYVKVGQAGWCSTNAPSGTTADNQGWGYIGPGGTYNGVVAWASGTTFREGGAYKTDNPNAANLFEGCYSEGDQNPSQMVSPTLVIGGSHGANIAGTMGWAQSYNGALRANKYVSVTQATGNYYAFGNVLGLELSHTTGGFHTLSWRGADLAWSLFNSDSPGVWPFRITGEATTANVGKRKMDFPNGFGLADKKILSGTAAPSSGTYVQGDMMFNSTPTAGGPMGWMCVAGGTPGTWKAMANLAA